MSPSKLELLPNEILIDIFEKYINGTDIITAFSYQLNRRFDALIAGCQRLRFNFIQCPMDQFRFCMGLFPAYIGLIEELALSERDTPGQVHAFLSFFPSFKPFEQLRKLYIHYDHQIIECNTMKRALLSLLDTSIESLSIKIEEEEEEQALEYEERITVSLNPILIDLLRIETLKRFCLVGRLDHIEWNSLSNMASKMESFIAPNTYWQLQDLQSILQWAPCLKYLHIGLCHYGSSSRNNSELKSKKNSIPVSALRTLILSCKVEDSLTMALLVPYLDAMPVLNRLEIKANSQLIDGDTWRMLLTTSLPLLTHFTLRINLSRLKTIGIENVRASFQNSFWISKKNFNVIITSNECGSSDHLRGYAQKRLSHKNFDQPVSQCWIIPDRRDDKYAITVDQMITTILLHGSDTLPDHYYFNNLKYLAICSIEKPLLRWITTHINCSQIKKLSMEFMSENIEEAVSLLTTTPNKISLYIDFNLLLACSDFFIEENNDLKRLDISTTHHKFKEEDITVIARLFPRLEHLVIKTPHLHNIPLLKTYLPHLNSITDTSEDGFYQRQHDLYDLRRRTNLLFRCNEDGINIWVDKAAYEDPFWNIFSLNSRTKPSSEKKILKKKIFSFLNIFKK